ncbi:MAG TPA: RbsD/FucU domain-containing protein, partial [Bacillota bacterium]|nr:RbsD/FucU domain-containing protein [Bacillota bacterium]
MLMEISSLITPEIYEVIYRMGHLDELVIADANYSASAMSKKVVYSYAPKNHELLAEILKYFPLDEDEQFPVNIMALDYGFYEEPRVWKDFQDVLTGLPDPKPITLNTIPRQEFYERTRNAYATIQTSDPRVMADIIIRKGFVFQE